jgi:hypothetical protein
MEAKAQEIASLMDKPDCVRRNRPFVDAATDRAFLDPLASTREQ